MNKDGVTMHAINCKNEPDHTLIWALGLMSGTSLDGVDAALIKTDGKRVVAHGESLTLPYTHAERAQIFACFKGEGDVPSAAHMLTLRHIDAVEALLAKSQIARTEVALIGFHGQTILHAPKRGITQQIGDAALLARKTGIPVVADFRTADVAAGGQGAPLVPLYHAALTAGFSHPVVVVNIGGVSNITYIDGDEIIACDTGPGNALMDDWMRRHTGADYDKDGMLAAAGVVQNTIVEQLLSHPFFKEYPPKSLDRNAFNQFVSPLIEPLSSGQGAATLCAFTAAAIAAIAPMLPKKPKQWIIVGGGRHNKTLLHMLNERLVNVYTAESVGFYGDALEAEAFAYLAVRSINKLPLSLPTTTGVKAPTLGGVYFAA